MIYFYIFIIVEKKFDNYDLFSFWVRMSALLELRYTSKLIRLNSLNSCGRRSIAIPKYSYVGNERTLKDRQKLGLSQICWGGCAMEEKVPKESCSRTGGSCWPASDEFARSYMFSSRAQEDIRDPTCYRVILTRVPSFANSSALKFPAIPLWPKLD